MQGVKNGVCMKILIFGTGKIYQRFSECFVRANVVGFLDNDSSKQGQCLNGIKIYSPDSVLFIDYQQIYLLSAKADEMRKQLVDLGVDEHCIFEVHELYKGLRDLLTPPKCWMYCIDGTKRYARKKEATGHLLLLTPNLNLNGAEVALCQLVRVLLILGYRPMVASLTDGDLRGELVGMGVPVLILGLAAHDIPLARQDCLGGAQAYILNTIEMYLLLQERDQNIPVLWWLHDSDMVYREMRIHDESLMHLDVDNIRIEAVSNVAREAFIEHYAKECRVGIMPYGLENWAKKKNTMRHDGKKMTFCVSGGLTKRKAQGDFIAAVALLPDKILDTCRFVLIGQGGGELLTELKAQAKNLPIEFLGEFSRNDMLRFYEEDLDVLVCPSLSDTLPIVTVEAMMFGCPVIASEAVGTSTLLIEYQAGMVVPVGDADKLASAMLWMFEHPEERTKMGTAAKKIYSDMFSLSDFKKRVEEVMQAILCKHE